MWSSRDGYFKSNYFPDGFCSFSTMLSPGNVTAQFHEAMGYKIGRSLRFQDWGERFQKDANGFHYTPGQIWQSTHGWYSIITRGNSRTRATFLMLSMVFSTLSHTFQSGFHCERLSKTFEREATYA